MNIPPRYRIEDGKACIDIKIATIRQLFDGRDPAPFRERDLDEDAVDYIVGAAEEISPKLDLKISIWISEPPSARIDDSTVVEAVHSHFAYELDRLRRSIRQHVRQGQFALGVGFSVLAVALGVAELVLVLPERGGREVLHEGLLIVGWVAMWRPLEVLLYDWWPLVRQRRLFNRVLAAEVSVVHARNSEEMLQRV